MVPDYYLYPNKLFSDQTHLNGTGARVYTEALYHLVESKLSLSQDNGVLFNSFQFLIFFVLVWVLVLSTRGTVRRVIILIASYYFYMCWSTRYIFVIWGITLLDYFAGLQIEKAEQQIFVVSTSI